MKLPGAIKGLDRKKAYTIVLSIVVFLAMLATANSAIERYRTMQKALTAKEREIERFRRLEALYLKKRAFLDSLRKRALSGRGRVSTVSIIENIARTIGLENRISTIKSTGSETKGEYLVREARVKIEGLNLNELVNLLYMIEHERALLIIKTFSMKSHFRNPNLYDVEFEIKHVSRQG